MPDPNPNPPSFWEWLTGKRTSDIRLPATSGMIDSRLPPPSSPLEAIRRLNEVTSGGDNQILQGLQNYGKNVAGIK